MSYGKNPQNKLSFFSKLCLDLKRLASAKPIVITILFLSITLGAFLRFYNLSQTFQFLGDQGRDASIVRRLLVDWDPILVGPTTSVGKIQLGPLYYYFMAPWLWLAQYRPIGPVIGVALLGVVTIPLLYWVTKKMFSEQAALVSTVLYAVSTVAIANSRFSWNPNPMPLVILGLIFSLYQVWVGNRRWWLVLSWFFWGIALQLHYMVLILSPLVLISWGMGLYTSKQKKEWLQFWGVGLLVFIVLLSPLIVFDLRHDFLNSKGFTEFFSKGHHTPREWWQPIMDMQGRLYQSIGQILGFEKWSRTRDVVSQLIVIGWIVYGLKNWKKPSFQLISLWLLVSVVGLSVYTGVVYEHYLGFLYPLSFIMVGVLLSALFNLNFVGKATAILILVLLLGVNLTQRGYAQSLSWTAQDVEQLSLIIAHDAEKSSQPFNILLIDGTKDYPAMGYRYFLETYKSPIEDSDTYTVPVLYVISEKPVTNWRKIETRELEAFYGKRINELKFANGKDVFTIELEQSFEGGPVLYKLRKV